MRREDEFAPVKNAPGAAADSPDTARRATLALHTRRAVFLRTLNPDPCHQTCAQHRAPRDAMRAAAHQEHAACRLFVKH